MPCSIGVHAVENSTLLVSKSKFVGTPSAGVRLEGANDTTVMYLESGTNLVVDNELFTLVGNEAIFVSNTVGGLIERNTVRGVTQECTRLQDTTPGITVRENSLHNGFATDRTAIRADGVDPVIEDTKDAAIAGDAFVLECTSSTFTGNVVKRAARDGFDLIRQAILVNLENNPVSDCGADLVRSPPSRSVPELQLHLVDARREALGGIDGATGLRRMQSNAREAVVSSVDDRGSDQCARNAPLAPFRLGVDVQEITLDRLPTRRSWQARQHEHGEASHGRARRVLREPRLTLTVLDALRERTSAIGVELRRFGIVQHLPDLSKQRRAKRGELAGVVRLGATDLGDSGLSFHGDRNGVDELGFGHSGHSSNRSSRRALVGTLGASPSRSAARSSARFRSSKADQLDQRIRNGARELKAVSRRHRERPSVAFRASRFVLPQGRDLLDSHDQPPIPELDAREYRGRRGGACHVHGGFLFAALCPSGIGSITGAHHVPQVGMCVSSLLPTTTGRIAVEPTASAPNAMRTESRRTSRWDSFRDECSASPRMRTTRSKRLRIPASDGAVTETSTRT